jgi:CHASE2 domain-containing sensor protein
MRALAAIVLLLLATLSACNRDQPQVIMGPAGGDFGSDFALVMIDDATEAKLGPFPYDRTQYARAIDACVRLKAKAVVLKFFYDLPKSANGDAALAIAMKAIPVAIQTRLDTTEGTAAAIPPKFRFAEQPLPAGEQGNLGWIPLPGLLATAAKVGFVDFDSPVIPLVENYRGASYPSLVLSCLELATGATARVGPGGKVFVGQGWLPVDAKNVFHGDLEHLEALQEISFASLLAGDVKPEAVAGRVVIIGWDSKNTPTLKTDHGEMGIHRLFVQCLANCQRQLNASLVDRPKN